MDNLLVGLFFVGVDAVERRSSSLSDFSTDKRRADLVTEITMQYVYNIKLDKTHLPVMQKMYLMFWHDEIS